MPPLPPLPPDPSPPVTGPPAEVPNVSGLPLLEAWSVLTEAGFTMGPDGFLRDAAGKRFELTINTTAGNPVREQIQVIMKEQFKAVGIELKIDNRPAGVLFGPFLRQRQYPHMVMYAWVMSPLTLPTLWHSNQIPTAANNWEGSNYPGWRNAENDKLVDQILEEIDTAKRVAKMFVREVFAGRYKPAPSITALAGKLRISIVRMSTATEPTEVAPRVMRVSLRTDFATRKAL